MREYMCIRVFVAREIDLCTREQKHQKNKTKKNTNYRNDDSSNSATRLSSLCVVKY